MLNGNRFSILAVALTALLAPAAASAKAPAGHDGGHGKAKGKAKPHAVTYVFKGTYNAADGSVTVASGNAHVRHAGLVGQHVTFDFSNARVVAADTNADGTATVADVKDGDKVLVQVRAPRRAVGTQPLSARKLVDQTNPPAAQDDNETQAKEAPEQPEQS